MTAMSAARLGDPEKAVGALLMDKRTNTYLVNGHNYQDSRPPRLSSWQWRLAYCRSHDVRRMGWKRDS
jgi:hypothetical protein